MEAKPGGGWGAVLSLYLLLSAGGTTETLGQDATVLFDDDLVTLPSREVAKKLYHCRPGPWGELEYFYTFLEAPEQIVDLMEIPASQTVWRFMGWHESQVRELIESLGLPKPMEVELIGKSQWYDVEDEVRVHPSASIVLALPREVRQKIYGVLRKWEENRFFYSPVVIESGTVRDYFAGAGLSETLVSAMEKTSYPFGNGLAFSDVAWLVGLTSSESEARAVMKALTRTRTLILRLKIGPESRLEKLSKYWVAGDRYNEPIPILDAVLRAKNIRHIDVVQLLPPTPRKNLYTYPSLSMGMSGAYPDDYSSALNFFEFWPKQRDQEDEGFREQIQQRYQSVQGPSLFGDILVLTDPQTGKWLHACVYIADDIVYTKNGDDIIRPWILIKYGDLVARQVNAGEVKVQSWRLRPDS
jgi:hypothetical protein